MGLGGVTVCYNPCTIEFTGFACLILLQLSEHDCCVKEITVSFCLFNYLITNYVSEPQILSELFIIFSFNSYNLKSLINRKGTKRNSSMLNILKCDQ